tara:strand:- start:1146 stop:1850 length:705 start_codon:yes stop_codon:yes gene_type:complete
MYLNKINTIYLHPPKTAGTYIESNLINFSDEMKTKVYGFQDGKNSFELTGAFTFHKHQTLQNYKEKMPYDIFKKSKILISVRNPLDRIISSYFGADDTKNTKTLGLIKNINRISYKLIKKNLFGKNFYRYNQPKFTEKDFLDYIDKIPNQSSYLLINDNFSKPDYILKYEELNKNLSEFFKENNLDLNLIKENKINQGIYKFDTKLIKDNQNIIQKIKLSHHFIDYQNFSYELS